MTDTEPKRRNRSAMIGCAATVALWAGLGLHVFADRIWDEEPPGLKWAVFGFGCLVVLGLLRSYTFSKRDERIGALIFLAAIPIWAVFIPPLRDRKAAADVDELVRELGEKGEAVDRQADALPAITDRTTRAELEQSLDRATADVQAQTGWSKDLLDRAAELFGRAPADKRGQLQGAIQQYNQRTGQAHDRRNEWIKQVRARVEALKMKAGGPK
jgi:hypothetical protein